MKQRHLVPVAARAGLDVDPAVRPVALGTGSRLRPGDL